MNWEIDDEEVRELFALPAGDRAVSFFQLIADWEEAWVLEDENGLVVGKETNALPLWPNLPCAAACARGPWEGSLPEPIHLDELLLDLLPQLAGDDLKIAVFPSPDDPGLILTPDEFGDRLEQELQIGG